jgi:hypothetical protein
MDTDTFLTLVIALGGIATGIGAIWAALAARRQGQVSERQAQLTEQSLAEQRQFLKEQNEIARHQTQLTEQSLAQTERSLSKQNERLRLNLALDLLTRLQDRFESPHFRSSRRAAAKYLLDSAIVEDRIIVAEHLNKAAWDVLGFFEEVGYLQRIEALQAEGVRNTFSWFVRPYWLVCKPTVEKFREEWQDPALYEEVEYLYRLMAGIDLRRGIEPPTQVQLREMLEYEVRLGEESSTTTPE